MDLRPVIFWQFFSVHKGHTEKLGQYTKITIRALTPTRRKIVDTVSLLFGVSYTVLLTIGIGTPVIEESNPSYYLMVIPILGFGFYLLTVALLIILLRAEKVILIDEKHIRIKRHFLGWYWYDRKNPLAFLDEAFSPLSNKKLEKELAEKKSTKTGKTVRQKKQYYKYSRQLVIEYKGVPRSIFPVHGVTLAKQVHRRLLSEINDVPIDGTKKTAETTADIWGNQAGDLGSLTGIEQ